MTDFHMTASNADHAETVKLAGTTVVAVDGSQTVTHAMLPTLPRSREPEDIAEWLEQEDGVDIELEASVVLMNGDTLTIRPGALNFSTD